MTTFTEGPQDSVKIAVQREAARRKRTFVFYLVLLAVPIAIGGYAIANAPTQTQAVAKEVIPVVSANVEETIEPKVAEALKTQAEPIIRDGLEKQLTPRLEAIVDRSVQVNLRKAIAVREQDPEIVALKREIAMLKEQVKDLQGRIPERRDPHTYKPVVAPVPQ